MTVIVYRNGIIASDSGIWGGKDVRVASVGKLARSPDGSIAGFAGCAASASKAMKEYEAGADWLGGENKFMPGGESAHDGLTMIVLDRDGHLYELNGGGIIDLGKDQPYYAIGSSESVALGALYAGASASEAVQAAIHHHNHAAGPVRTLRLVPIQIKEAA